MKINVGSIVRYHDYLNHKDDIGMVVEITRFSEPTMCRVCFEGAIPCIDTEEWVDIVYLHLVE